jgi:hypothetical protein
MTLRNGYLAAGLKRLEQHHTIALNDIIVLKQQVAKRAPRYRKPG